MKQYTKQLLIEQTYKNTRNSVSINSRFIDEDAVCEVALSIFMKA